MNRTASTILVIALLAIVLIVGYTIGNSRGVSTGKDEVKQELQPIVDVAYPKPPEVAYAVSGTVRGVYAPTIHVEVTDPDDYLPHTDGSPRRTAIRYITVTADTKITLTDSTKFDAYGNPLVRTIAAQDIHPDDRLTVRSSINIRNELKIDADLLEVLR